MRRLSLSSNEIGPPFLEPGTDLHAGADFGRGLAFKVEGKQPDAHRAAAQLTLAVPTLLQLPPGQGEQNGFLAVEIRLDAIRSLIGKTPTGIGKYLPSSAFPVSIVTD
jgi:hypothetical protein